jgi:hypothetical protein
MKFKKSPGKSSFDETSAEAIFLKQLALATIQNLQGSTPWVLNGAMEAGGDILHGAHCSAGLRGQQGDPQKSDRSAALLPGCAALRKGDNAGMERARNAHGYISRIHRLADDEEDGASGQAVTEHCEPPDWEARAHWETSADRRKRKLVWLCERHSRPKVAEWGEVSEAYLRQIINENPLPSKRKEGGKRIPQVGDDLARRLESKVPGLCYAWFDNDLPGDKVSASGKQLTAYMHPARGRESSPIDSNGVSDEQLSPTMVLEIASIIAAYCDQAPIRPTFAEYFSMVVGAVEHVQRKIEQEGAGAAAAIVDDLVGRMRFGHREAAGRKD